MRIFIPRNHAEMFKKKENAFQVFDSLTICINCQIKKKHEMLFISSRLCQMDEQTSVMIMTI